MYPLADNRTNKYHELRTIALSVTHSVSHFTFTALLLLLLLLLLHDLYSANFEDRVGGAGVARWRTWLTGEGEKVRF